MSVVIPTWNGRQLLDDCLAAVASQTLAPDETIVVDDGSTDETEQYLRQSHRTVRVIRHATNRGFAAAVNTGIKNSNGDFVVLLNNDAVVEPEWLGALVAEAISASSDVGMVTSKILRSDTGRIDTTGDFLTVHGVPWSRGSGELDYGQFDTFCDVFGACAGATLYRRSMFDDIGMFDERFFAYYEDVDLSVRARRRGWRARYAPSAVVHHRVHGTSGGRRGFLRYQTTRNTCFLLIKVMPTRAWARALPSFVALQCANIVGAVRAGEVRDLVRAYRDALRYVSPLLEDRQALRDAAVVSDRELARELVRIPLAVVAGWRRG